MSRRGALLPPEVSIDGISICAPFADPLHLVLVYFGYELQLPVRSFRHRNGDTTSRYVWRNRSRGVSASIVRSVRRAAE